MLPIAAQASNIKPENDERYTVDDFFAFYPQFNTIIPNVVLESFLEMTNACVNKKRFGAMWRVASGLFCAHFCALWLQNSKRAGTPAEEVLSACAAAGVVTSESADGVSYSMDTSMLTNDLAGWAAFKLTAYGAQFATMAKLVGKGGMYIW